jgi:hypothetical protein
MDIILDTNVYYALVQKEGRGFTNANAYVQLVTYLRQTNSRLVILEPVLQEILARYSDLVSLSAKKASDAWTTLQHDSMTSAKELPRFQIENELSIFRTRILDRASSFTLIHYNGYSSVSVEEVFRRGVFRIPPANPEGEELRDVVIWLMALDFAAANKQPIAFITDDSHFKDNEGKLHPTLAEDAKARDIAVSYYESIYAFIRANALAIIPVTHEEINLLIRQEEIIRLLTKALTGSTIREGTINQAEISSPNLVDVRKYQVSTESFYLEASYTVPAQLLVQEPPPVTFDFLSKPFSRIGTPGLLTFHDLTESQTERPGVLSMFSLYTPPKPPTPPPTEKLFLATINLKLSARMVGTVREPLEITSLTFAELYPVNSP